MEKAHYFSNVWVHDIVHLAVVYNCPLLFTSVLLRKLQRFSFLCSDKTIDQMGGSA